MENSLYDEMWRTEQTHWWYVGRRRIVYSLVEQFEPRAANEPLRICELGCGTGGNLAPWATRHDVVGVDSSRRALEFARRRLGSRVVYGRLPDAIPLPPGSFDVILMTDVLEHIDEDRRAAQTAMTLLRPGGILVATVPAYQWLYCPRDRHHHHFRRYGKAQFRRLFEVSDVSIELLSFYNTILFAPATSVRLAGKFLRPHAGPGDMSVPAAPVNRILTETFASEARLLSLCSLPFGLSLIGAFRRKAMVKGAAAA